MDNVVGYSNSEQIRQFSSTLGGPEVAILLPGSYSHLQLNSIIMGTKSSALHPLKIPSFNSIKVNKPFMIQ